MHLTDNSLCAYLDQQLPESERSRIESHLQDCPECAERLAELSALASQVSLRLAALKPAPAEAARPASLALRQFYQRRHVPCLKSFRNEICARCG